MLFKFNSTARKKRLAYYISRAGDAYVFFLILALLILFSDYLAGYNRWWWGAGLVFILGIMPISVFWLGLKKGKIKDIDFTRRQDRTPYLLILLFFWIIGMILSWSLYGPKLIIILLFIAVLVNIIILLINFYWKISNHALVASVFGLFVNQLFGWQHWWLLLIIPVVAWSRWVQKKHTLGQLVGGMSVGIVAWLVLMMFGY